MGLFDNLAGMAGGLDIGALAQRIGLSEAQVQQVLGALGQAQASPGDTATQASQQSGVPLDKVQALLAQIGGEGALGKLSGMLGGAGGGLGGLFKQ